LKSALSDKLKLGKLTILEGSKCDGKSASLKKKLDVMGLQNVLIISGKDIDHNFIRAASNIMNIDVLSYEGLNVYDIVRKENLVIIDDAVKFVEERLL
jgi:large subunit ribosomal protein L4